jgi:hypothetical protein
MDRQPQIVFRARSRRVKTNVVLPVEGPSGIGGGYKWDLLERPLQLRHLQLHM